MQEFYSRKWLGITVLYMGLLAAVSLSPGKPQEGAEATLAEIIHNCAHVPAYVILSYCIFKGFSALNAVIYLLTFGIAFGFGLLMEYGQIFVPYRFPSFSDLLLNTLGIFITLFAFRRGIWKLH